MDTFNKNIKPILALLIILSGFAYFFATTFAGVRPHDQELIAVVGLMSTAAGYYFGASTGTARKDETISRLADRNR